MEFRQELTNVSIWVYVWFSLLLVLWFASFAWLWQFSLSCTLFVIPFIFFIRWWYKNRIQCSLNDVLKPFLHGFINITLLAFLLQFIGICIIFAFFAGTTILYYSVGGLLCYLVSITYYVCVEEGLKLYFSLKSRDSVHDPVSQITKIHTITSTGTALGYSTCTGILWTALAAHILDEHNFRNHNLFGWLFLIGFIIAVIGMPMHLITGYCIGCKITKRDIEFNEQYHNNGNNNPNNISRLPFKSYINVIYISIFIRSTYLFFVFVGFLVLTFTFTGVIVGIFGIIVDYILIIRHTKQTESELPFDYLQRAGQLSIFGYNVLPDADNNDMMLNEDIRAEEFNKIAVNESDVQITTVTLNNFSCSPEMANKPMMIGSNHDETVLSPKEPEKVDIHVREDLLDQDLSSSDSSDSESQPSIR